VLDCRRGRAYSDSDCRALPLVCHQDLLESYLQEKSYGEGEDAGQEAKTWCVLTELSDVRHRLTLRGCLSQRPGPWICRTRSRPR
jgi:hypothetical protein